MTDPPCYEGKDYGSLVFMENAGERSMILRVR